MTKVLKQVSKMQGWNFVALRGKQNAIPDRADIVLYMHSLIDIDDIRSPFLGIHVIRDPRDIIVSGYLYHQRTTEAWCTNRNHHVQGPIIFPQVPYSQEHRPEVWKAAYLAALDGKSYQENLLHISQSEGINFEMNNYGSWTIDSMRKWDYGKQNILEVRFEDIMSSYQKTFNKIFDHVQFDQRIKKVATSIVGKHDISQMSQDEVRNMNHVSSLQTTRWKKYFNHQHRNRFIARFDSVLIDLGYERDNSWVL